MRKVLFVLMFATIISCKKDNNLPDVPPPSNPPELITNITLTFTDPLGVNPTVTAIFSDPDGPGGAAPVRFDTIKLVPSVTYNCSITLFDESKNPVKDLTPEVLDESKDHLFCFDVTTVDVGITRTDTDGTFEVGLASSWVAGVASSGSVKVTLKHQVGVKNGTCAPGETDLEVTFVTKIE